MNVSKQEIIENLGSMTVMEMANLVHELEELWGVSATPVPVPYEGINHDDLAPPQSEFDVVLSSYGEKKINVIKAIRTLIPGIGLKEAKNLIESAPALIKEGTSKEDAEELKTTLEEAGATVEIK